MHLINLSVSVLQMGTMQHEMTLFAWHTTQLCDNGDNELDTDSCGGCSEFSRAEIDHNFYQYHGAK